MVPNCYTHKCSKCNTPLTPAQVATGMYYGCGEVKGTAKSLKNVGYI